MESSYFQLGVRQYAPVIGRFLSVGSLWDSPYDLNPYYFVNKVSHENQIYYFNLHINSDLRRISHWLYSIPITETIQ